MPYLFFAWVASISSGLVIIITKLTSKHVISNPWLFSFLRAVVVVAFIVPIALINHAAMPHDWIPLIFAGTTVALFYIFFTATIYRLDVSTVSPLFNLATVFTVLLGVLFFQEKFTTHQTLLSVIIITAGIFTTIDERFHLRSFFNPSVGIALIAMAFLALYNGFIRWATIQNSVWTVNLWVGIIGLLVISTTIPLFYKDLLKIKIRELWPLCVMGIFQTITNFAIATTLAINVGISSIIMSIPFSMIFAVLFSIFAPKLLEKHTTRIYIIRFSAATIMVYCALQLSQ